MYQGGRGSASKCKRCDMTLCLQSKFIVFDMTDEEVRALKTRGTLSLHLADLLSIRARCQVSGKRVLVLDSGLVGTYRLS